MNELIQLLSHPTLLWTLGISSAVCFIGSLLVIPWLVVRIPVNYFCDEYRHRVPWAKQNPLLRWLLLILKNLLGLVFLLLGIAMLVLPGQGLLTILIALVLLNFPGKYRLERRLFRVPSVRKGVNWLRKRAGREPLKFDGEV
ncbi:PGPGW domain-containing protein [Oceanimonas sp. CHS3-5]|uniref:PGPGW domain-containing protein n=1 Tax=Oceanimonas sp. CHS3-5 TaxID=3068186 RepID=UPI00273E537B|nr:PGPGW domain-containing protein [Oceanimonas sp. CHS3-5]MDP5293790.1 PGPGW domain-containing protein [Oceanimonas sp. CHS3-5]